MEASNFPNLPALLFNWKQSYQLPVEEEPPKSPLQPIRRKSLLERFIPSLKRGFRLHVRKNTIALPGIATPKPHPQSWFNGQESRPIYALIIGIDKYQHLPSLEGAANDAEAVSQYVRTTLKVPAESIVELRNEAATRAEILRAFHALSQRSERRPRKDDSILIYYAGYGGPLQTSLDGVQTIISADYSAAADNAISAVTAAELVEGLVALKRSKGDHITMIFDCGGDVQEGKREATRFTSSRVVALPEVSIGSGHTPERTVISGNVFILSACSQGEAAREVKGHGLFTNTLIKQLKREGSSNMTRANVLTRLSQIPSQTPQAHGEVTDTPIFDTGLSPPEQIAHSISIERGQYTVHAGSVAGVTPGARFFVYRDKTRLSKKKPKAFTAERISLFTTTLARSSEEPLKPLLNLPAAIPFGSGRRHDLVVYLPIKDALKPVYQVALKLLYPSVDDAYRFLFTEDQSIADIVLDVAEGDDHLKIIVLDERVALHGFPRIPVSVPLNNDDVERFLLHAAHFYRHLNHSTLNKSIGELVSVEFLKLDDSDTEYDDNGHPYRYPVGSDLFASGIAEVQVDPEDPDNYGFKITNKSDKDLYAYVFYFDHSDLSIAKYHPQETEQTPIPKDGGVLTIGYDNPGTTAYSYFVREGQDMDIGFVKVVFSQEPIELPSFPQTTIYQDTNYEPVVGKQKETEKKVVEMPRLAPAPDSDLDKIWGSVMFPVVQHRVKEDDDSYDP